MVAKSKSAIPTFGSMFEASKMMYVGAARRKSKILCMKEMKVALNIKNITGWQ